MPITNLKHLAPTTVTRDYIGTNSATISANDLVGLSGGFATKLGTTGLVEGIATTTKTFASDNQTVAKATVKVILPTKNMTFTLPCTSASLAQTDVGAYFNLDASQNVDYATKTSYSSFIDTTSASATDALVIKQVRLVKYVGQNTSEYELVRID